MRNPRHRIIRPALTSFWASFNPDLPDPEELLDVPLNDLWDVIRLRTAPWGADDWELPTPSDSLVDDDGSGFSQTSDVSTPSTLDEGVVWESFLVLVGSLVAF